MIKTKLTVRVDRDLLENIKRYAVENHTTLTDLIDAYLRHVSTQTNSDTTPIVRRISGTLSKNVSIEDYRDHLEEKYAE